MKLVPKKLTRTVTKAVLKSKKNSPHIFFIGGVIGVVGGTVMACRATLKVEEVLDECNDELKEVKALGQSKMTTMANYSDSDYYKDLGYVYVKNGARLVRLYGPSVVVTGVSIAALTGAHVTLTRRNAALTAAFTAVSKAYDEYRNRVREELGVEKELDIYHAATTEAVTLEDGSKQLVKVVDPDALSPYARFFDEYSTCWNRDAELNRLFVEVQQRWLNDRLQARGFVFLNEAYERLGLSQTQAGQIVGWVWNSDIGDNYIDFGLYEARNRHFGINEQSALLDFNVDGVIYDKIEGNHHE